MFLLAYSMTPSFGCSLAAPPTLAIQSAMGDIVLPNGPELVGVDVTRGRGPRGVLVQSASSCDDLGFITVTVRRPAGDPDDDAAVGYRFALAAGTLPDGFELPARDGEPWLGPDLNLSWIDGATDEQEAFAFTVELIPVDRAGNEGPALDVEVSSQGQERTGCDSAGAAAAGIGSLLALSLWARRRGARAKIGL